MKDTLATRLKQLRLRSGLTQAQLAERTKLYKPPKGVDRTAIGKIESGKRSNPGMEMLQALANALGVTIDDLTPDAPQLALSTAKDTRHQVLLSRVTRKVNDVSDTELLQRILEYIEFITSH